GKDAMRIGSAGRERGLVGDRHRAGIAGAGARAAHREHAGGGRGTAAAATDALRLDGFGIISTGGDGAGRDDAHRAALAARPAAAAHGDDAGQIAAAIAPTTAPAL